MHRSEVKLTHPESADLAFLYGTILTDGKDAMSCDTTCNLCIFADRQVISPCMCSHVFPWQPHHSGASTYCTRDSWGRVLCPLERGSPLLGGITMGLQLVLCSDGDLLSGQFLGVSFSIRRGGE